MHYFRAFGLILILLALALASGHATGDEPRQPLRSWKDDSGNFEVTARFLGVERDSVRLEKESGKVVLVPLARLSSADRELIGRLSAEKPAALEGPEAPEKTGPAGDALVLVTVQRGNSTQTVPGLVIRAREGKAYVVTGPVDFGQAFGPAGMMGMTAPTNQKPEVISATISWGPENKRHTIKADELTLLSGRVICAASAKEMPLPLARSSNIELREGLGVRVEGWTTNGTRETPVFARTSAAGKLKKIDKVPEGKGIAEERFIFGNLAIEGANLASVHSGVILGPKGDTVGFMLFSPPRKEAGKEIEKNITRAATMPQLDTIENPRPEFFRFVPTAGDEKTIEYLFGVYLQDPFHLARSPQLFIKKVENAPYSPRPVAHFLSEKQEKFAADAETLTPRPSKAQEDAARWIPSRSSIALLATHKTENPGPIEKHQFMVQFSYVDAAGTRLYYNPRVVQFSMAAYQAEFDRVASTLRLGSPKAPVLTNELMKIPGLNGKPLGSSPSAPPK